MAQGKQSQRGSSDPTPDQIQDNLARSKGDLDRWNEAAGRALGGDTTATPPAPTR